MINGSTYDSTYLSLRVPLGVAGKPKIYHRRGQAPSPSKFVAMTDGYFCNFSMVSARFNARHNSFMTNLLFLDGAVGSRDVESIPSNFYLSNLKKYDTMWRINQ